MFNLEGKLGSLYLNVITKNGKLNDTYSPMAFTTLASWEAAKNFIPNIFSAQNTDKTRR